MTEATPLASEQITRPARKYPAWAKFAVKPDYVGQEVLIYRTVEAARFERRRGVAPGQLCKIVNNALVEIRA